MNIDIIYVKKIRSFAEIPRLIISIETIIK